MDWLAARQDDIEKQPAYPCERLIACRNPFLAEIEVLGLDLLELAQLTHDHELPKSRRAVTVTAANFGHAVDGLAAPMPAR
jgi:hypothetical protein